jgi:hypothetical protein
MTASYVFAGELQASADRFKTLLEDERHGQNGMYAHILTRTDPSLEMAFTNVGKY